jgi:hypothetical protein
MTPCLAVTEKARRVVGGTEPPKPCLATTKAEERAINLRVGGYWSSTGLGLGLGHLCRSRRWYWGLRGCLGVALD